MNTTQNTLTLIEEWCTLHKLTVNESKLQLSCLVKIETIKAMISIRKCLLIVKHVSSRNIYKYNYLGIEIDGDLVLA